MKKLKDLKKLMQNDFWSRLSKKSKFWTQKTGEKIEIAKMTNEHLFNTIKFVEKKYYNYCMGNALMAYDYAGTTGGEMASYAAGQEGDNLMEEADTFERIEENCPLYKCLIKEANKRNLEWN